jgi:CelD/BcsL family acetyltransferase involved in cellulose biosynthesis
MTPLCLRVLDSVRLLDEEADEWRALWARCVGARSPFLSFEWIRAWVEHYGQDEGLHVLVVQDEDRVVGIMPLVRCRQGIGPLALHTLETIGAQSRNRIALVQPDVTGEVASVIVDHLRSAMLSRGLCLRLSLVPAGLPLLRALKESFAATGSGVQWCERPASQAPYVPLPAFPEDLLVMLGRRRRKVLGRAWRRLERDRHDVVFERHSGDGVQAAMSELYRLHQARWSEVGIRGLFRDEPGRAFHDRIARDFDRLGWLRLSSMKVSGQTASVHLVVILDGVAYFLRSGRDSRFSEYSVGHLHYVHLFREAIAAGLWEADFLRGAEPYKFYWTRTYRTYVEVIVIGCAGPMPIPASAAYLWLRIARFLSHRHTPRELYGILRIRRWEAQERRRMGLVE